jgi:hypothetical protein
MYKRQWCIILQLLLPNSHPHLLAVYSVPTNEATTTESYRYNCFTRNGGNAVPKRSCPEVKGSNPTTDLTNSGLVNHAGEILSTGKSHKNKPDGLKFNLWYVYFSMWIHTISSTEKTPLNSPRITHSRQTPFDFPHWNLDATEIKQCCHTNNSSTLSNYVQGFQEQIFITNLTEIQEISVIYLNQEK